MVTEQRSIQSVELGFRLIRALQQTGAKMTLKSVAEMAGMSAAKAHLYMVSFMRVGLVAQDPVTSRYSLGPYAIELGLSAIRQIDVTELAREPMQNFQSEIGLPVFLSMWGNLGPAIVLKLDWNTVLPVTMKIGYVLPLLSSATGQVFLAYLPDHETASVLDRETSVGFDPGDLARIRDKVRKNRLATSKGRLNVGFAGISTGVFDHDNRVAAAITALGFAGQIDVDPYGSQAKMLREAADAVSVRLGADMAAFGGNL